MADDIKDIDELANAWVKIIEDANILSSTFVGDGNHNLLATY
jgi:hypothetical protein